jgi:hypothetical protein
MLKAAALILVLTGLVACTGTSQIPEDFDASFEF